MQTTTLVVSNRVGECKSCSWKYGQETQSSVYWPSQFIHDNTHVLADENKLDSSDHVERVIWKLLKVEGLTNHPSSG